MKLFVTLTAFLMVLVVTGVFSVTCMHVCSVCMRGEENMYSTRMHAEYVHAEESMRKREIINQVD